MEKFENLKEYLKEKGYSDKEINNIVNLIIYDFNIADQYEECFDDDGFNVDLFHKNYEIYTDKQNFINEWFNDDELISNEQLIDRINSYGGSLSVSYDKDMTTFIADIR